MKATKAGAYNYVTKPWEDENDLITLIRAAARDRLERTAVLDGSHFSRMFEDAKGVRPGKYRRRVTDV